MTLPRVLRRVSDEMARPHLKTFRKTERSRRPSPPRESGDTSPWDAPDRSPQERTRPASTACRGTHGCLPQTRRSAAVAPRPQILAGSELEIGPANRVRARGPGASSRGQRPSRFWVRLLGRPDRSPPRAPRPFAGPHRPDAGARARGRLPFGPRERRPGRKVGAPPHPRGCRRPHGLDGARPRARDPAVHPHRRGPDWNAGCGQRRPRAVRVGRAGGAD